MQIAELSLLRADAQEYIVAHLDLKKNEEIGMFALKVVTVIFVT